MVVFFFILNLIVLNFILLVGRKMDAGLQAGRTADRVGFKKIERRQFHEFCHQLTCRYRSFHHRQHELRRQQNMFDAITHAFHDINIAVLNGADGTGLFTNPAVVGAEALLGNFGVLRPLQFRRERAQPHDVSMLTVNQQSIASHLPEAGLHGGVFETDNAARLAFIKTQWAVGWNGKRLITGLLNHQA